MYALLFQVSKSGHRDVEGIVLMLGRCLPHIVPNVLLTKREVGFVCFVLQSVTTLVMIMAQSWKEQGNVLFNDTLNTFHLRLYGVRHMVKDYSDRERINMLPPHGLLFLISSMGSFICIIPHTGYHIPHTSS